MLEKQNIPISKNIFTEEDFQLIQEPLKNGWVVQGPFVKQFEEMFAHFVGAKHAIATTSCTTALHIAVAALGIGTGDEVIIPSFTWISTANAIEYMGAKPVFIDIELDTFNIDVSQLERLITPRTKAIIPVHLFGLPANMSVIVEIAEKYGLKVIEDAACGLGSRINNDHVGCMGDIGCFSFHPRKSITTGEGGMIVTNNDHLAERCRVLRNHGASVSTLSEQPLPFLLNDYNHLGYNFRMTDIQGALGVAQMQKVKWFIDERRRIAEKYQELLSSIPWLKLPTFNSEMIHSFQSYVCLYVPEAPILDNVERLHGGRNQLMQYLDERGIATRQGTHSPSLTNYYRNKYNIRREDFPNAVLAEDLSIAIPLFPGLHDMQINYVVQQLQHYSL